ncbi:AAA family ATPase [Nonomuraea typhae]|uniref:nucleotide-binding protein n=1 Tax=Nonomuraea typhae TaxID=2603600 RepID=UPI001FE8B679|nr:AAA family ATPase [Nonomuraea typhae]
MARHDREESLEEQLAWLDAIKETEETPVGVSATAETAASPYPKDPWLSVPSAQETPTPPLFRAAVDSVYGPAAAEELPATETEAAEWLGEEATTEPPAPSGDDDEAESFLAPLKPLPRPDDTDAAFKLPPIPDETPKPAPKGEYVEADTEPDNAWPKPAEWSRSAFDLPKSSDFSQTIDLPEAPFGPVAEAPPAAGADDEEERLQKRFEAFKPDWEPRNDLFDDAAKRAYGPGTGPAPEHEPTDRGTAERGVADRGVAERGTAERAAAERGPAGRGVADRGAPDRGTGDRAADERPLGERPFAERPFGEGAFSERPLGERTGGSGASGTSGASGASGAFGDERPFAKDAFTDPEPPPAPAPAYTEPAPAERPRRRSAAPIPVFTAPPRPPVSGKPTADSLDPESLLRGRRNAPSKGWRRLVYKASGGWIKPGEPAEVRRRRELLNRARTPVATGHHRVAVLSLKGGVGKTTTTVGLGATLAQVRGDRVIAVDANPDRGTLSDKLELETSATVRDLLNERAQVKRYVDIRAFTSQAPSRLEVLASDRDPSVSEAFSGEDYQAAAQVLENFYSICITDCGTGLLHSAMGGVLGLADQIVLVSSPSVDGARAASATLDWLEAHHYGNLVREATVVLCSVRPRSKSAVDIKKLEAHFAARCRAVIRVPYDPHLEEGAEIDLDRLQEATRESYLQLAACIGDGFAGPAQPSNSF